MKEVVDAVLAELESLGDPAVREGGQRFFKEEVRLYGLKSAAVTKIAKQHFKEVKHLPKDDIFGLCELLWQNGHLEATGVACNWAHALRPQYESRDMAVFENWVSNYVSNWAACDTLCNHPVGSLVTMYPKLSETLKPWAQAKNRWMRRAAAVSLIVPARRGLFLGDIFTIADILLEDDDDMVQKGYGWMLKAASQAHMQLVFDYVMARRELMPRTALRYAIEKLPPEMRKAAMQK